MFFKTNVTISFTHSTYIYVIQPPKYTTRTERNATKGRKLPCFHNTEVLTQQINSIIEMSKLNFKKTITNASVLLIYTESVLNIIKNKLY